nr:hypothetical protein [Tanacetum cinerariifolium]
MVYGVTGQVMVYGEIRKKEKLLQLEQWAYLSTHPLKRLNSFCYDDDDEDYTLTVTPVLSTEEPDNSLSIGDEHLDTIPAMESDKFIKSSVEDLISIPSESEGIPEHKCDVPSYDNSLPFDVSKDQFEDFSESNDEFSSTDDDSFSIDKIDYVEASPPDSELVSSMVMEIVIPEVGGIDDDILRENLLNVNHLFAKIEASNETPIPFYDPIISGTPLTLTPSGESDFFLEVDAFLAVEDEPIHLNFLNQSFHFDIPLFSRPPAKPPDGDTGILNIKMMGDIYGQKAFMHKLMITLAPHQEKSPDLLSHRGLKAFQPLATCPMMIHG